jgi:hypothetical protein
MEKITKIRAEINKLETKQIQRINIIKSWFFEKINKIAKHLAKLTIRKRKETHTKTIRDEKGYQNEDK